MNAPGLRRSLADVVAAASLLVPGLAYWTYTAPPFSPGLSSVAATMALVAVLLTFRQPSSRPRLPATAARHPWCLLVLAVACGVGYCLLLDLCSVVPEGETKRLQVGFGTAEWNLTKTTREWMSQADEEPTKEELMDRRGGYADDGAGVYKIWQRWAVYLAAALLIGLFLLSLNLWTLGWVLLSQDTPEGEARVGPKPTARSSASTAAVTSRIFISYRREDSQELAHRVCDSLRKHFGHEAVFMDVDTIPPGLDFRQSISDALASCEVVLAVIGPRWLHPDQEGRRRLDDPNDYVRLEIERALNRGIPVVPLLVGPTSMPKENDLPASLAPFAYRHGLSVDPGLDFGNHLERTIQAIEQHFAKGERLRPSGHAAAPG
jgi:hypothetical protein